MRSLEEWTKYLEQQERTLRKASEHKAPEESEHSKHPAGLDPEFASVLGKPAIKIRAHKPHVAESRPQVAARTIEKAEAPARTPEQPPKPKQFKLPDTSKRETAQHSYKDFKETREGLLQRLLDPEVSLEEAARILNVCPASVRRYTNRGLLKHYRTPGNQRRFKLSDVLAFMESKQAGGEKTFSDQ